MTTSTTSTTAITPADLAAITAVHESGNYGLDSITGEPCTHVPSTGEWLTEQQVVALVFGLGFDEDDDEDEDADEDADDDGRACRIIERGGGFAGVVVGAIVPGGDHLYRIARVYSGIRTDDPRGNYLLAEVVEVDWSATDDDEPVKASVAFTASDEDDDDNDCG